MFGGQQCGKFCRHYWIQKSCGRQEKQLLLVGIQDSDDNTVRVQYSTSMWATRRLEHQEFYTKV